MKPAITATTAILVSALAAGVALAQSPGMVQKTRNTMSAVGNHAPANASPTVSHGPQGSSAAPGFRGPMAAKRRGPRGHGAVLVQAAPAPAPKAAPEKSTAAVPEVASVPAGAEGENEQAVVPDSKYSANGRRDPFISPVVSHTGGSGCSTGKKCLEIGAVNLRGVVRSESGFIAVVSNGLNKAYFLRENDPVFNGYVVKITGDSIVFQETVQDRLGKTFTREVVKKITTPAA
jgi:hypothetical protein